jgi:hypothetical protein
VLSLEAIAVLAQVAAWIVAGLMAVVFVYCDYRHRKPDPEFDELEAAVEAERRRRRLP